eukprot:COSAG02_NODE_17384_length_1008_cov_0.801980_2_plen_109_part_01
MSGAAVNTEADLVMDGAESDVAEHGTPPEDPLAAAAAAERAPPTPGEPEPEPEPEPDLTASALLPSAAEFCGDGTGLSLAGILRCIDDFGITDAATTTSDLCHAHIKPA